MVLERHRNAAYHHLSSKKASSTKHRKRCQGEGAGATSRKAGSLAPDWRQTLTRHRLKAERQAWEAILEIPSPKADSDTASLSPLNLDLLSSPERHIYDQLQARTEEVPDQHDIVQRLQDISRDLEFSVDLVSHSVHAVDTTRQVAERIAEQSLGDAATILQQRHEGLAAKDGPRIDALDALKGLARVLNAPP